MKTVGLVTFWDYNFGSALQCFSMKKTINSFGYRCNLIEERHTGKAQRYSRLAKKLILLPFKVLAHPSYLKAYKEQRRLARNSSSALSKETADLIHFFGRTQLQPRELSKKSLHQIGKNNNYIAFITGSDQVWGGHFAEPTYGNFLEFAPQEKRISYAASFGGKTIANYNISKYKKGISGIRYISVRENSGITLVKELFNKDAVKMPDPTILTTVEEWSAFSATTKAESEPYILVHFLDKLNPTAFNTLKIIAEKTKMKVICLGWKRDDVLSLPNAFFRNASPQEYIYLIKNAAYICTDSYHTTLFSLRFNRNFYTFKRTHSARFEQTGRITELLNETGCSDRYITEDINNFDCLSQKAADCSEYFNSQREIGLDYLKNALDSIHSPSVPTINLKDYDECCGCGICAEKCPQNAIKMVFNEKGYSVPKINPTLCISCKICEKVCRKEVSREQTEKTSFIAYNKDSKMLDSSASGGVFSALAKSIIENNGKAYGAALNYDKTGVSVSHRCASSIDELYPLLQSKYAQSSLNSTFTDIKNKLENSELILFSGTSCQVDALYRYLGKNYPTLYTLDLICHGVPGEKFFKDYTDFLQKKNKSTITSFSFREKENNKINYIQSAEYTNGKRIKTKVDNSIYYKMFFAEDSYRDCCYSCPFASVNKPADITVGDYFEAKKDYPELFEENAALHNKNGISCIIIHTSRGEELLKNFSEKLKLFPVETYKVQNSHNNLCMPSTCTDSREKMMAIYHSGGITKLQMHNNLINALQIFPRAVKKTLRFILEKVK